MEIIEDQGNTLAIIYRTKDWKPGLDFPTPNGFFVQAGCWHYDKGKRLRDHQHKDYERTANRTQEVTYVRQGRLKAYVYNEERKPVKEVILETGDFAVWAYGGHGYEILEDNTQVLEVKNGPFVSAEHDKEVFG